MDQQTIFGVAVLGGYIVLLIAVFIQYRTSANLLQALTDVAKAAAANDKALDLLEPLATKVVPVSLVNAFNFGADFMKSFTSDQIDAFIDAVRLWVNKATDGKPNTDTVGETPVVNG
jgi:hypothetical protein